MKIAFDARYAQEDLVGVGKYIKYLVTELSGKGIECTLFYSQQPAYKISGENIYSKILPTNNRYIFEQILLPIAFLKEKFDIYHALGNNGIPIFCPIKSVLTVHDVIPLEIKDYFSYSPFPILSKLSYLFRLITSLSLAKKIITVSNYTKNEVINKFWINSKKIYAIHSGSPVLGKVSSLPESLKNKEYILNNGGIDIRKNLDTLIDSFLLVNQKYPKMKLVITGKNDRIQNILQKQIAKLGLTDSVIFTGYITDEKLGAAIKSSKLVCYPTLSEGFGFPILEAFGYGVPVITSNTSAIPEIAGSAAILVDPKNVDELSNAINEGLVNHNLRQKMISEGKKRYNMFNWEKTANEYISLYNSL